MCVAGRPSGQGQGRAGWGGREAAMELMGTAIAIAIARREGFCKSGVGGVGVSLSPSVRPSVHDAWGERMPTRLPAT